jgi:hypothetical protein
MGEIQESKDEIVNELIKINKRLDSIHSWLAAFIIISELFYIVLFYLIMAPI